jgi:hypothetical protein
MTLNLFGESGKGGRWRADLGLAAVVLCSFVALNEAAIFATRQGLTAEAPFPRK